MAAEDAAGAGGAGAGAGAAGCCDGGKVPSCICGGSAKYHRLRSSVVRTRPISCSTREGQMTCTAHTAGAWEEELFTLRSSAGGGAASPTAHTSSQPVTSQPDKPQSRMKRRINNNAVLVECARTFESSGRLLWALRKRRLCL